MSLSYFEIRDDLYGMCTPQSSQYYEAVQNLAPRAGCISCPSTTPFLHVGEPVKDKELLQFDTLKVSFWVDWRRALVNPLDELRKAREALQQTKNDEWRMFRKLGGRQFLISRYGAGKYPYRLKAGDCEILFSNHTHKAAFPNVRIEVGSMSCWSPGGINAVRALASELPAMGGRIDKEKVTEAHIACDVFGISLSGKSKLERSISDYSYWSKLQKHFALYRENSYVTGLQFGKGSLLRIYDKGLELKKNGAKSLFFHDLWFKEVGYVPLKNAPVTRVEYQLRRDFLYKHGIDTFEDLVSKFNGLWKYLTSRYNRHMEKADRNFGSEGTHRKTDKIKTSKFWKRVQAAYLEEGGWGLVERSKKRHKDAKALVAQAVGCLQTVAAMYGFDPSDLYGHITYAFDKVEVKMRELFEDYSQYVFNMQNKGLLCNGNL